jgi:D-aspartate ligase
VVYLLRATVDTRTPVVVLTGNVAVSGGSLAIARTLGRLGVSAYLITGMRSRTPVSVSRYWCNTIRWDFSQPEDRTVAFLAQVGRELGARHGASPVLLTAEDWPAVFIERQAAALEREFRFPKTAQPTIHRLADKWTMNGLATDHDIPTPRTSFPQSPADVDDFLDATPFPIVLKAADPYRSHVPEKRILTSRHELMSLVEREQSFGPLNFVLQEYIPGDATSVWMCNGYFGVRDAASYVFTGRKIRQASPMGVALLSVCLPNKTVEAQTRSFMTSVGYRGCVGIGYRYDQRDGQFKLLDVNARVSGVFRLFSAADGMDLVRACYLDLTGQDPPPIVPRIGRKLMIEGDIVRALAAIKSGQLTIPAWRESLKGVRELQWSASDDPKPLFLWLTHGARKATGGTADRIRRQIRTWVG